MLLQRNINAFSISLTDRGLRMDGDGVGNRTKPSSVSVNDFYQELQNSIIFIKNYGITEFIFYQELRNYRILLSECGPSDGFFFNSLILDKRKECAIRTLLRHEKRERDMLPDSVVGGGTLFYFYDRDASSSKLYVLIFG